MASDTSLVFNVLARDRATSVFNKLRATAATTGRDIGQFLAGNASREIRRLDGDIERSKQKIRELGAEFERTGDRKVFGQMRAEISNLSVMQRAGKALSAVAEDSRGALGNLGTAVTNLTTNIYNWIPALLAAAAAMSAAAPAAYVLGGALASLPAVLAGGGAAALTLKLGLGGLAEAYQAATTATAGAGGAARDTAGLHRAVASAARDVTRAERGIAEAQKDARRAQEAVNAARKTAAERLSDMSRELTSARLDEESAVLSVAEAQADLDRAVREGDDLDIQRAELAFRQAEQAVLDVRDRVEDLSDEHEDASRKGVEGSDEVVQALERQAEAQQRVADAQERHLEATERLADAQKALNAPSGGGGGAAKQLMKLAPSAQKFLDTIIALRPRFEALRLNVQERLFAGLAGHLKTMAGRWLPTLNTLLGNMAGTFNGFIKDLMTNASKPKFIANISAGVESVRKAIGRVGKAISGPFLDAFGRLSRAAAPFIEALGEEVGKLVEEFSAWIATLDNSGKLDSFFSTAIQWMRDLFQMGKDVASIIGSLMQIAFGSDAGKAGEGGIKNLQKGLQDLAAWLKDPENQAKVKAFFTNVQRFVEWLANDAMPKIAGWINTFAGWVEKVKNFGAKVNEVWGKIKGGFNTAKNAITGAFDRLVSFVAGLPRRISTAARGMWDGIKHSFKTVVNWLIWKWNSLSFTVGGGSFAGHTLPSYTLSTPDIPYLAKGGTVTAAGMAVVGERGPELLSLNKGAQVTPLAAGRGDQTVRLELVGEREVVAFVRRLVRTANLSPA